jgi:hypothetical protein
VHKFKSKVCSKTRGKLSWETPQNKKKKVSGAQSKRSQRERAQERTPRQKESKRAPVLTPVIPRDLQKKKKNPSQRKGSVEWLKV